MLFANVVVKVATVTPLLAWMRWCTFLYFSMAGLIEAEFAGTLTAISTSVHLNLQAVLCCSKRGLKPLRHFANCSHQVRKNRTFQQETMLSTPSAFAGAMEKTPTS